MRATAPELGELLKNVSKPKQVAKHGRQLWDHKTQAPP